MILDLRTAIYDQLLTSTYVSSSNLFFDEAPQGEDIDPYFVFSYVSNPITRDTGADYEELVFQVSIYGTAISTLEAAAIDVLSVFKNSETDLTMMLSANTVVAIVPQYTTLLKVPDIDWWQLVLRFRMMLK